MVSDSIGPGLSADQLTELRERGHVLVPGVVDTAGVAQMQERVWEFLESRGVARDSPQNWPDTIEKLQPLRRQGAFDPFLGDTIDQICDQLIGRGKWTDLGGRPQALLSLPVAGPWLLPRKQWHFDLPARGPTASLGAIRFLGFVDGVKRHGGATIAIEGSHRLVRRMVEAAPGGDAGSSADARRRLARLPFFAELESPRTATETSMNDGRFDRATIDGVAVRVRELTGEAGDLVVMHPWVMHNIAMNCSDRPRMMMSYTRYATDHPWF